MKPNRTSHFNSSQRISDRVRTNFARSMRIKEWPPFHLKNQATKKRPSKVQDSSGRRYLETSKLILSELDDQYLQQALAPVVEVPGERKITNFYPCVQGGHRITCINCRPVTLISVVWQILECLICEVIGLYWSHFHTQYWCISCLKTWLCMP